MRPKSSLRARQKPGDAIHHLFSAKKDGLRREVWLTLAFVAYMVLCLCPTAVAEEAIPFVGCPGSFAGQPRPAFLAKDSAYQSGLVTVHLQHIPPGQLAFYDGPFGPGLITPRGWHCFYLKANDGNYSMFVAPTESDLRSYKVFGASGTSALGMVYNSWEQYTAIILDGYAKSLFYHENPQDVLAKAIKSHRINEQSIIPLYHTDIISFKSKDTVKFVTPVDKDGLGTWVKWEFHKSKLPIYGILRVTPDDAYAELLLIRFPKNLTYLRDDVLDDFQ